MLLWLQAFVATLDTAFVLYENIELLLQTTMLGSSMPRRPSLFLNHYFFCMQAWKWDIYSCMQAWKWDIYSLSTLREREVGQILRRESYVLFVVINFKVVLLLFI